VINLPPRLRLQGGYRVFIFSAAATPPNLGGEFPTRHIVANPGFQRFALQEGGSLGLDPPINKFLQGRR